LIIHAIQPLPLSDTPHTKSTVGLFRAFKGATIIPPSIVWLIVDYTIEEQEENVENDCDFTLEILMTDLDKEINKQFYQGQNVTAKSVTKNSGIGDLFPNAILDEFLFTPCGYSMNGLLNSGYFTIHVTPQPTCSYVSFETNIECDYSLMLKRVVHLFKPQKFSVSLFAGHITTKEFRGMTESTMKDLIRTEDTKFRRQECVRNIYENHYQLAFATYVDSRSAKKRKQH